MAFLELTDVRKQFGIAVAVEDFNLKVERGEFISFLGPSGCGKTTTLRMIAGFETPTVGKIAIGGRDVTRLAPNKRNIGMVFQSYALFPNMTVADNIGFGMRVAGKPKEQIRERVDEMLRLIHLPELGRRYPYQLSGGQQQRVALARALAVEPQVLLLDEPLSALDAKIRVSLRTEIRAIQQQLGITTIYVTHDQEEALSLSDRIVVMNAGRVEQIGTPFQIYNFPETPFVGTFVGTLNVIQSRVLDAERGLLEVDGQNIDLGRPITHSADGRVALALRPEVISIDEPVDGQVRLHGVVEQITFLGPTVRVLVRVGSTALQSYIFNSPRLVVPGHGQEVTVSFPAEACLELERAAGTPIGAEALDAAERMV